MTRGTKIALMVFTGALSVFFGSFALNGLLVLAAGGAIGAIPLVFTVLCILSFLLLLNVSQSNSFERSSHFSLLSTLGSDQSRDNEHDSGLTKEPGHYPSPNAAPKPAQQAQKKEQELPEIAAPDAATSMNMR